MSALGKLASDRITNLILYCTVIENALLISLLIGYINQNKQMVRQKKYNEISG